MGLELTDQDRDAYLDDAFVLDQHLDHLAGGLLGRTVVAGSNRML